MLTKENLLAIDCKHVLRAVSAGSFTLYNYTFTIVSFLDCLTRYLNRFMVISYKIPVSLYKKRTAYVLYGWPIHVYS